MKDLYIDIDGVILTKEGKPANYLFEFLDYVTKNFDCYWLTTHCRGGENRAVEHITMRNELPPEVISLLNKVKPTAWGTWKTDAINFEEDFMWLDDYIMEAEKEVLRKNNCLNKAILMDSKLNPDQLSDIIKFLN